MIKIDSPIGVVSKIGPKYKKYLEKLDIETVEDLLYHFPFRYDDYSQIKRIKDVIEGEIVSVRGVLGPVDNIYTRYGKRLTKAKIIDFTGELNIIWFNQQYLKSTLKIGKSYTLSGRVGLSDRRLTLVSPEIEETKENSVNTGRLVPVYAETYGITSKWLRARINDVLSNDLDQKDLEDYLPEYLKEKYSYRDFKWSLNQIHFPDSSAQANIARKRFAFEELLIELINVEERKLDWSKKFVGYPMQPFTEQIVGFIKCLPFQLTESQQKSIQDIIKDFEKPIPMNRLLEGDVGSGKTVVAVIAAYLAYLNGYKTLYMAPTEILANQHYTTFLELYKQTDIKVDLSTGATKNKDKVWDVLIGTHSILYSKEKFENIGLVVVDEQHRFGVEQRGKIVELGKGQYVPNMLTMTATPIPRTLALTLYGDLDISSLEAQPNKKRNIATKVVPDSKREEAYAWINNKNEPTFIVCPLIDESESASLENVKAAQAEYEKLRNDIFKNKNVGLLHGRMKSEEKKEMVEKFRTGEINVLVSTPVIEVGIDIPDASIIVIESAERYGLASLHQLRGRVGRSGREGYCFVFMSNYSKNAYSRLKNLEVINEGLKLAELDMKLRGQGDIFSTLQHGFKKFKLADFDDFEMLEQAKISAQDLIQNMEQYPLLKNKINKVNSKYIKNN